MRMSTRGRYGLRVMMELASRFGSGPVQVEAIARSQDISAKYIHVLVAGLKLSGLVRAVRGPSGGYELTRDPSSITALDVVHALEGRSSPAPCVADRGACPRSGRCAARDVWCDVAFAIDQVLADLTLSDLALKQASI